MNFNGKMNLIWYVDVLSYITSDISISKVIIGLKFLLLLSLVALNLSENSAGDDDCVKIVKITDQLEEVGHSEHWHTMSH